jgi:hypothetical protein
MARSCSICARTDRADIDALLVSKIALRDIAKRVGGVTISALSRHHTAHVGPELAAIHGEVVRQQRPLTERLEELVDRVERILAAAEGSGAVSQALAAVRELRGLYELVGKVTGELKDGPQVAVVNVLTDATFLRAQAAIFAELEGQPEVRARIAARLTALEAPA